MEQTRTGSFRHPIRMRQTDLRRAMRSPEGVATMMREAAMDKRMDRMDGARREERQMDRQDELADRADERLYSMRMAMRHRNLSKADKAEDLAYETERERQKREQDEADFRSYEDAPGNPDYLMNRRGMTLPKAKAEAPMPTAEEIQQRGLRPTGYDARGQPTGYEDARPQTLKIYDPLNPSKVIVWDPGLELPSGYEQAKPKGTGQQQQPPPPPMPGGRTNKSGNSFQLKQ